jgi:signal transduction histidine kinase
MTETTFTPDGRTPPVGGELRLPKAPGIIRQFWIRHPWWTDSLIASAYLLGAVTPAVLLLIVPPAHEPWRAPLGLLLGIASATTLLFRRHRPRLMLAAAWVITLGSALVWDMVEPVLIPILLYAVAVYSSARAAWLGFAWSLLVACGAGALSTVFTRPDPLTHTSGALLLIMLVGTLMGVNSGNRRRYVAALVDRAAQLARERDQQALLAAAVERSRIAREMHDIVSHSLTVMVTLAEGSAAMTGAEPARAANAMKLVAETGRESLGDMRRMLGLLNDGSSGSNGSEQPVATLEPQPGIAELGPLVESFRSTGVPVRLVIDGRPAGDSGVQVTVYRIVQEALTNALRHARDATEVLVEVAFADTAVTVTVLDNGRGTRASVVSGSGRGLVGMRERVALYGGTLESAPRRHGGWRTRATMSLDTTETDER